MKLRITLLFLLVILASGCGVSSALPQKEVFKMGKNTWISNYEIIQTIDEGFGLAVSRSNFMVIAIKSSSEFYPMYDGEAIKGSFVMVDTYTY